jgi:hypothetical protein
MNAPTTVLKCEEEAEKFIEKLLTKQQEYDMIILSNQGGIKNA